MAANQSNNPDSAPQATDFLQLNRRLAVVRHPVTRWACLASVQESLRVVARNHPDMDKTGVIYDCESGEPIMAISRAPRGFLGSWAIVSSLLPDTTGVQSAHAVRLLGPAGKERGLKPAGKTWEYELHMQNYPAGAFGSSVASMETGLLAEHRSTLTDDVPMDHLRDMDTELALAMYQGMVALAPELAELQP
ncbi:MAG TPA: hypothetical protein VLF69_01255 [Candidatus Saccharimonadales bacterium]|nr:hypothetical protein [Candidatus Saccharimonadales bacterium]